ncbi:ATP-binding protein [Anaerosalibacter massiliensis]|uniref:ATP-binding protein n=1 Tax=Anaerosalibacter massiliensis TaxID=1347392 RepID=A0A9X2MHL8_9FIRM|nr:ATP-binding protein [Anaerosalibacter massiliensis]MCR2043302.1 ATP-binding protein [Anaerosalibacter massiliensis]
MELVVLSGKGGTGKTTIATTLSEFAKDVVRVDCDVEASNFYLFYDGKDIKKEDFYGGKVAYIDEDKCIKCARCEEACNFDAITNLIVDPFVCEGCNACTLVCPVDAIELRDEKSAEVFMTEIDSSTISRAEMEIGSDASGKLITYLRKNSNKFSRNEKLTIIDGSPGIGCPVIASVTDSDIALIVTEPTISGLEDLKRVVGLCEHFGVIVLVCINKYNINEEMSKKIEDYIEEKSLELVGKIPYDEMVMKSINELKPINYYDESIAKKAIEKMWLNIKELIFEEV